MNILCWPFKDNLGSFETDLQLFCHKLDPLIITRSFAFWFCCCPERVGNISSAMHTYFISSKFTKEAMLQLLIRAITKIENNVCTVLKHTTYKYIFHLVSKKMSLSIHSIAILLAQGQIILTQSKFKLLGAAGKPLPGKSFDRLMMNYLLLEPIQPKFMLFQNHVWTDIGYLASLDTMLYTD